MAEAVKRRETFPAENEEVFVFPASSAQRRLWFLDRVEPDSCTYNLPLAFRITGPVNLQALEQSLDNIIERHEALRTTFSRNEDGELEQVVHSHTTFSLSRIKLDENSEELEEGELHILLAKEASRPFDLSSGPLFRAAIAQLSEEEHLLLMVAHHIVMDGWSARILLRELALYYQAAVAGVSSPMPQLRIQYGDFATWQRESLQGTRLQELLSFWKQQVVGAATLELPTDRPRPRAQTFRGSERFILVPKPDVDRMKRLAKESSATLFMFVVAAANVLLSRYTGQEDIIVGTPIAGRNRSELEHLIGLFANTVILRTDLSGNPSFRQVLSTVRKVAMDAYSHDELPIEKLIEELKLPRDLGRNPLFQVLVNFQNASDELPVIPGLKLTPLRVETGTAKFDLSIGMIEKREGLRVRIAYNTRLFDDSTIERMLENFEVLLASILADPDRRISELPLISRNESQLLQGWNSTQREFYQGCVHEWFEQQVAATPNKIAAKHGQKALSYFELNHRANQLANYLRKRGVGPEVRVGLFVERSLEMLVAMLGILKAGGAYIPLDPAYPKDRVAFILEDANAQILLTQVSLCSLLAQKTTVVCLDSDWPDIRLESGQNLPPAAKSDNLAYVLYTSGSTGQPKGVQVEHRNLANFLTAMQCEPGIDAADTVIALTTISFDIAGLELYLPLVTGAEVVIASREEAFDAGKLQFLLRASNATLVQATPTTWRMLIDAGWAGSTKLKVLCGGEALPADLALQLIPRCSELWNMYGPTETTIWSSIYRVTSGLTPAPIGHPIANTSFHILDRNLGPVPVGASGELHIGGEGVARGYLSRPQLNRDKFIADPFSGKEGARLYRTGDLAKFLPDGNVQYLGRTDFQVKIRGFRIELEEIETIMGQHPSVQQAVVSAREDYPGDQRLVCYIVPKPGGMADQLAVGELRAHLKKTLPDYMLPSVFVFLDQLPLTPNGKINRGGLPVPQASPRAEVIAPRNQAERVLLEIWQRVLNTSPIGVTDNFFEVGGHSLLAVRLVSEIKKVTGKEIPLTALFQDATIEHLAGLIRTPESIRHRTLIEIQSSGSLPTLFAVIVPGVNALGYVTLSKHMGTDQPFYALQGPGERVANRPYTPQEYEDMAWNYIRAMRELQPQGPYYFGGMCEGAHIAFEMARLLENAGEKVNLLAIFDTWVLENSQNRFLWHFHYYFRRVSQWRRLPASGKLKILDKTVQTAARRIFKKEVENRSQWPNTYWPGKDFVPPKLRAKITIFKNRKQPFYYVQDAFLGWRNRTSSGVEVYPISSKHRQILREPYVTDLAKQLRECVETIQSSSQYIPQDITLPSPLASASFQEALAQPGIVEENVNFSRHSNLSASDAIPPQMNASQNRVLVSIVIPVYNAASYISETLDSVLAQTFTSFEVILVNDGSLDTADLEKALVPYRSRIRYIKQENRGPSAARNVAIQHAVGKYLAFLDGDDIWLPHHLSQQIEILTKDRGLGLVYSNGLHLREASPLGTAFESVPQSGAVNFESLLAEQCTINTTSVVVLREAVLRVGLFDESLRRCEDFDLWLRLAQAGVRMSYDRDVQICHRLSNGLAADRELMKRARARVYRKFSAAGGLTVTQNEIVAGKLEALEVEIQVEVAKQSLLDGRFNEALSAAEHANFLACTTKLRIVEFGLRSFPHFVRWSYKIYLRFLSWKERNGEIRFMKTAGVPMYFRSLMRSRSQQ